MSKYFTMSCKFSRFFPIFALIFCVKSENITNLKVHSTVDLTQQIVRVKEIISFVNGGPNTLKSFSYTLSEPKLHFVTFFNNNGQELNSIKIESNSTFSHYDIVLDEDVGVNESYKIISKIIYADKILPVQKKRKIEEDQLMKFKGNVRFYSPYKTDIFKIEYKLLNYSLEDVTKIPTEQYDDKIVYLFYNIKPYTDRNIEIIFVNNKAFLVVKNLRRTIDINHFGKISVEDNVIIENNGAKLTGPYTHKLLPGQRKGGSDWLYTHLPASAENIKFFDELGNSSKTRIYNFYNYATLKFIPRYSLFGGWKSNYILQYDVPTHEYLHTRFKNYILQIRSIDYVIDDVLIENAEVKIILPEGAHIENIIAPSLLSSRKGKSSFLGGLAIFGRPTILLNGSNLFENYIADVHIKYSFTFLYLLRAPLLISFYFQIVFAVILCKSYFF